MEWRQHSSSQVETGQMIDHQNLDTKIFFKNLSIITILKKTSQSIKNHYLLFTFFGATFDIFYSASKIWKAFVVKFEG